MTLDCKNINLKKGSKGKLVTELQTQLKAWKYYTRKVDGSYGDYTKAAVKKLQKDTKNTQDGIFGPITCKSYHEKLNKKTTTQSPAVNSFDCKNMNLKKGDKGDLVTRLQKILKEWGFYTRQVDGDFGDYTDQAVKDFQSKNNLAVDGVYGPVTCNKLNSKLTTNKSVTPAKNKIIKKEIVIDSKKYNFLSIDKANCTIEGIHFLITQIDDVNSFSNKPWKSLELMNDNFFDYKGHKQRLEYKLTTLLTDKEYHQVKNALLLMQEKKGCQVICKGIESGKYLISISRSHENIDLWKFVFNLIGV